MSRVNGVDIWVGKINVAKGLGEIGGENPEG